MASYLEVWRPDGVQLVALEANRITLGAHPDADVVIASDRTVSRLHAVLEHFPAGWVIRDLGSANGTFVNGERVTGDRTFRAGDEARVGRTRLLLRDSAAESHPPTERAQPPPPLTPRERDVLVELCRPVLAGDLFTAPASTRQIAEALGITEAAVKQHLLHLYDKFEVYVEPSRRRANLANEAVRRGAVGLADLRATSEGPEP